MIYLFCQNVIIRNIINHSIKDVPIPSTDFAMRISDIKPFFMSYERTHEHLIMLSRMGCIRYEIGDTDPNAIEKSFKILVNKELFETYIQTKKIITGFVVTFLLNVAVFFLGYLVGKP